MNENSEAASIWRPVMGNNQPYSKAAASAHSWVVESILDPRNVGISLGGQLQPRCDRPWQHDKEADQRKRTRAGE
jgi:hypothetical protein